MLGKTHYAVGLAASLAVMQPKTFTECAVAVIGGAVGGVLADNDTLRSDRRPDATIGQLLAFGTAALALLPDYVFHLGICRAIASTSGSSLYGAIGFVILYLIGVHSHHRTFTHSFLAFALYTAAVSLIHPPLRIPFATGYLSHLALDVLNKKAVSLFYPFGQGICLKLCYAGKTANKVFLYVGLALSAVLLVRGLIASITGV